MEPLKRASSIARSGCAAAFVLAGTCPVSAGDAEALFVEKIRPLLAKKCLSRHGDDPKKIKGDYDMRTREGVLAGGESGEPAVIPGDPERSPLVVAIRWENSLLEMPPKENDRLRREEIDLVVKWIEDGVMWLAGGGVPAGTAVGATDETGLEAADVVHPIKDIHCTMLHLLGLDDNKLTDFHGVRYKQLSQTGGEVIKEFVTI